MPELAPGIDQSAGKQGGEPCIAGTRVPVRRVGHLAEQVGVDPTDIADRFDVSLADVHRALAYYYDHADEMAAYDRRDRRLERGAEDAESVEDARDRLADDR